MAVDLNDVVVFVWEGSADIGLRIQQGLANTDIAVVRVDPGMPEPPARQAGQRAVAVLSVSVIGDVHFTGQEWLRTEAVPVIWVAAEGRGLDSRFYPPAYANTLPSMFTGAELRTMVLRAVQREGGNVERVGVRHGPFVADCAAMRTLMHDVELYAACDASVVIHGETGTGKERVAEHLHELSLRASGPFVAVNCGAVPEGLFESQFFGYAKGAFTGAISSHKGYFEQADGGTLFLDEIGDLPLHQQVKLLRVLEQRSITRLGSAVTTSVDFRLISASHHSLSALTEDGRFRSDLYYRLAVVELEVPNLEVRGPLEIQNLFEALIAQVVSGVLEPVPEWLLARVAMMQFPGNIRELANLAERVGVYVARTGIWERTALERILDQFASVTVNMAPSPAALLLPGEQAEREHILKALEENGWRRQDTAAMLGISRKALWEKMRRLRIQGQGEGVVTA